MRTTSELRKIWGPSCAARLEKVIMHSGARVNVAPETAEAWRALDMLMQQHKYAPGAGTGAYHCRAITGGKGLSLHAFGIAVDINPHANPYRKDNMLITDMPQPMVRAIKAIRTKAGQTVFRWGGDYRDIKDTMHFEVVASRSELAHGLDWDTVRERRYSPQAPHTWPVLQRRDTGPTVTELQRRLTAAGFPVGDIDGRFGQKTQDAVEAYERSRAIAADGIVDVRVWAALLTDQPATDDDASPTKEWAMPTTGDSGNWPVIRLGDHGPAVLHLQQLLLGLGYPCGNADGRFGPMTQRETRRFQTSAQTEVDGIVGSATWAALLAPTGDLSDTRSNGSKPKRPRVHLVASGERLVDLGARYGVAWQHIADLNGIREPWIIRPGSKVKIPS